MHLLLYVDVLSLPIFHVVPLIWSTFQSIFSERASSSPSLISTCDLSNWVSCSIWIPCNFLLYELVYREKNKTISFPLVFHQYWPFRPHVVVSFEIDFNVCFQAQIIFAVRGSSKQLFKLNGSDIDSGLPELMLIGLYKTMCCWELPNGLLMMELFWFMVT